MNKNSGILKFFGAVLLGSLGGVLACQIILPWLAGLPFFENISWMKNGREGVTVINRNEKVILTEDQGIEDAIGRAKGAVAGVISQRTQKTTGGILETPETLAQGTGIFISSDGLLAVSDLFVPENAQRTMVLFGGKQLQATLARRDEKNGLVLLKVEEKNLPVLPFFENELKLGERVFLMDAKSADIFVNMGFVESSKPQPVIFFQTQKTTGAPIFNIKGEIVGLGLLQDSGGQMAVVPARIIQELIK
ncbi:MAG: serine protease [Candidatus Portnoybacteria bacterium]|nr:serine protease [Candidatus Portnoybacteria bacterium]